MQSLCNFCIHANAPPAAPIPEAAQESAASAVPTVEEIPFIAWSKEQDLLNSFKSAAVPEGWTVRERRDNEGNLIDCFVEAPKENGMAYGLEVLGDDYKGYGGVERKLEHCQVIVRLINSEAAPIPEYLRKLIEEAERIIVASISRKRAGHLNCGELTMDAEKFLQLKSKMLPPAATTQPTLDPRIAKLVDNVRRIKVDFDTFDGDRRGVADALEQAERKLVDALLAAYDPTT